MFDYVRLPTPGMLHEFTLALLDLSTRGQPDVPQELCSLLIVYCSLCACEARVMRWPETCA